MSVEHPAPPTAAASVAAIATPPPQPVGFLPSRAGVPTGTPPRRHQAARGGRPDADASTETGGERPGWRRYTTPTRLPFSVRAPPQEGEPWV